MTSAILTNSELLLLSKFRGCMIGSLIGDCLGAPFEGNARVSKTILKSRFSRLLNGNPIQVFRYTDDTCMTLSVASSLVENQKVDAKDMAKKFVAEFYSQPKRGYGMNVTSVFSALRDSNFEDVFLPAKKQFEGSGSFGNGAAMRIAPIALFSHYKTEESLKNDVEECSRLTHTHPYGFNGAILQCFAVKAALETDSSKDFDPVDFITELEEKMKTIEKMGNKKYCKKLKKIKDIYLRKHEDMSALAIAEYLGNNVCAHKSVATAIDSFLRGMKPLDEFEAIGGDTDTIASMAGSIAGAYYGVEAIPEELQEHCELRDKVSQLADQLYDVSKNVTA